MSVALEGTERAIAIATRKAEEAIQRILLKLEHDTMMSVDVVTVDTRNFARLSTEVFLTKKTRM